MEGMTKYQISAHYLQNYGIIEEPSFCMLLLSHSCYNDMLYSYYDIALCVLVYIYL